LAGFLLLGGFGVLVSLPLGGAAARYGRNLGLGGAARTPEFTTKNFADWEYRMSYLYAAYVATWVIHIAYLGSLLRRYTRLRNEIAEFKSRVEEK
jgi:hypothetical protein